MGSKKKQYDNLEITDIEYQGYGIARLDGKVIFVEHALPGEVVDVRLRRNKRDHAFAFVLNYRKRSERRVTPFCEHFGPCGGCKWQYLGYADQLQYKEYFVREVMRRIGKLEDAPIQPIIGCETDRRYRNKMEYSFSTGRWLTQDEVESGASVEDRRALGFHVRGRYDRVIDLNECHLQPEPSNAIRNAVNAFAREQELPYFDHVTHEGFLRTLVIRTTSTGETMVILVLAYEQEEWRRRVLDFIAERFPEVTSLYYIINERKNDSVIGLPAHYYAGRAYLLERCGELELKIGPQSFYQTNSEQAERLYAVVASWAGLQGTETVYDLYCGIGSIGLYLAPEAARVIGIESVEDAIADGRENARHNGITNMEFVHGEAESVLDEAFTERRSAPDLVVLDPPRAGLHRDAVDAVMRLAPKQILYVSCKPSTQARDLQLFRERYDVLRMQPVDMFPQTYHIENVCDLRLRGQEPSRS